MTSGPVGWYIHHQGGGHLARFLAIRPHLPGSVVCYSSLPAPEVLPDGTEWVTLPRDDAAEDGADPRRADPDAGGLLHWAPLGHRGHRERMAGIASHASARGLVVFVVDVSAEVTLLVRLLGIPVVLITQPGVRDDEPHRLAFGIADRVIAPWPGSLLAPAHLANTRRPVVYTGGISRFDGRAIEPGERSGVLVLGGGGVTEGSAVDLERAAAATPGHRWWGRGIPGSAASGWTPDPWPDLSRAAVVVSWAGQNAIADLAAADARAVVIPRPRPFSEQIETARVLDSAGLAQVIGEWPDARAWPALLERTLRSEPRWALWQVRGAAARAAEVIADVAEGRS